MNTVEKGILASESGMVAGPEVEKKGIGPCEIWLVDDNAPGYSALLKSYQKDNPAAAFKIFGNYQAASEEISQRFKEGKKLPDMIYTGDDRDAIADYKNKRRNPLDNSQGIKLVTDSIESGRKRLAEEAGDNQEVLAKSFEDAGLDYPPTFVDIRKEQLKVSGELYNSFEHTLGWREAERKLPVLEEEVEERGQSRKAA